MNLLNPFSPAILRKSETEKKQKKQLKIVMPKRIERIESQD